MNKSPNSLYWNIMGHMDKKFKRSIKTVLHNDETIKIPCIPDHIQYFRFIDSYKNLQQFKGGTKNMTDRQAHTLTFRGLFKDWEQTSPVWGFVQ